MTAQWRIYHGDCRAVLAGLPEGSVHAAVTSPPYWGLRDYGLPPLDWADGWRGCLGLEPTPESYVAHLVEVFRQVRRVLRDDGTLWLNLGDSYFSNGGHADTACTDRRGRYNIGNRPEHDRRDFRCRPTGGLKKKDLVGIPWRAAFALQADGWYLRMDVVWHKPNAMPESVMDRPTRAHEYMFLLSKSERYFYDADAIAEPVTAGYRGSTFTKGKTAAVRKDVGQKPRAEAGMRNRRSVWTVPTEPVKEAHFATYPSALLDPCILAGTSAHGACARCGAPWERVTGAPVPAAGRPSGNRARRFHDGTDSNLPTGMGTSVPWAPSVRPTIRWEPRCDCGAAAVPCTVLDPFSGSGTTAIAALRHGRSFVGAELSKKYIGIARARIDDDCPMLNRFNEATDVAGGRP